MKPRRKYTKREERVHTAICRYLAYSYPGIIFHSDASGVKLTIGQAVALKNTRSIGKVPDLFIAEPVTPFAGLYLEIKNSPEEIYTKAGALRKQKHIQAQAATLKKLRAKGYCAMFAGGFDTARTYIDLYMKGKMKVEP